MRSPLRSLGAAGLLLRRLRMEQGIALLIVLLVATTSFVFAAGPRLLNRVSDEGLEHALRAAPPAERNITLELDSVLPAGVEGGVSGIRAHGELLASELPTSIASLISFRQVRFTSVRLTVLDPPSYDTRISLRYQDGFTDATRLVAGRWPVDRGVPLRYPDSPEDGEPPDGEPPAGPPEPVILEGALSAAAAEEIGVEVGDRLAVTLDSSDRLLAGTRGHRIAPAEIEIVGLYEPIEPGVEYWNGDPDLLQATQRGEPDAPLAYATAYVPAEMYPSLLPSGLPFKYEWRLWIDPDRFDADQVAQVQADLGSLRLITARSGPTVQGTVVVVTGLPGIVDRYAAQQARAETVLSIAAIGPFGLACGAVAMVAVLLARRRRAMLALARGRGASGALVLGTQVWEAILLAGSACLVGLLAAVALIEARSSPLSAILAIAVGGAATLLLAGAAWPAARRPLGQVGREDQPVVRVSPRRLVLEGTIVAIAIAATLLLRSRGLTVDGPDDVARADPLLASVPVLSGLAAGIVALRLYPIPIRALGWLAARRRDIVPVLGLRTIARQRAAANLPLLVLMLTAAFGAFSSVVASSLDRGQVVASYRTAGADYRVEHAGIGGIGGLSVLAGTAIPGVEAVATGMIDTSAPFGSVPNQRAFLFFEAVDPRAYEAVLAGAPVDPAWPASFLVEPPGAGVGTEERPIPAILSDRLPAASAGIAPGDTFRVSVRGQSLTFELVERRASFPGIDEGRNFAVVPFNWVRAAFGDRPPPPTELWLRGSAEAEEALASTIADLRATARVVSRYDAYAAVHDAPFGSAIATGYVIALVVASIYMALTIIGAQVLSASRRARDLAYLRTLGMTPSQAAGLSVVEHAPVLVLALIPGVALGIGVAVLCEPGLGLATFVGASGVPLYVDWPALAVIVAALVAVMVAAVALGTWLSRRARLVDALRIGED